MLHLCRNLYSGRIDSSNCCLWLCEFIIFFLSVLIIPQETVFLEISLYKFTLLFPSSAAVLEVSSHSEPAPPVGPSASPSLSAHRPPFHICLLLRTPLDQFQFELHSLRKPPTSHSNPLSPNITHPRKGKRFKSFHFGKVKLSCCWIWFPPAPTWRTQQEEWRLGIPTQIPRGAVHRDTDKPGGCSLSGSVFLAHVSFFQDILLLSRLK